MSSNEETEDEILKISYTNRHKRRLAHRRSVNECKKMLEKIIKKRNNDICNDDSETNFSCNINIRTQNVVALQSSCNIQVLAEDCESVNKENYTNYTTTIQVKH